MQYGYYSAEAIKKRQWEREKALARKVLWKSLKAFFWAAVVGTLGFIAAYQMLIYAIDQNIDQSNIRDCQGVQERIDPGQWKNLQDKCQHFYQTGEIEYMRKYHPELDR